MIVVERELHLATSMRPTPSTLSQHDLLRGALLGTAIGDAAGLPYEGLSRDRTRRLLSDRALLQDGLLGRQVSDDTEHALMVIRAFARAGAEQVTDSRSTFCEGFASAFGRELRRWLLAGPPGIGYATLRGTLKSFVMERSGAWSAGNGPAMRAAVLGLLAADEAQLAELTERSARLTHRDPLASEGALLVSLFARGSCLESLAGRARSDELRVPLELAALRLKEDRPAGALADELGLSGGVTGYVVHTVPLALYCAERHLLTSGPSAFLPAVREAIALGGDTDTVAAIVGGVIGARLGIRAVPRDALKDVLSDAFLVANVDAVAPLLSRHRSRDLAEAITLPRWPFWLRAVRNIGFTLLLVVTLLRRLLPPY